VCLTHVNQHRIYTRTTRPCPEDNQGDRFTSAGPGDVTKDDDRKKGLRALLKIGSSANRKSGSDNKAIEEEVFWPQELLAVDFPQARIWTYGYNADVIGVLYKEANNLNTVSQHGRDLAETLRRDIDNDAGALLTGVRQACTHETPGSHHLRSAQSWRNHLESCKMSSHERVSESKDCSDFEC